MKKVTSSLLLVVSLFFSSFLSAQTIVDSTLYVYLKGGKVDAYPRGVVKIQEQTANELRLTLNNDSLISYAVSDLDSLGTAPENFPVFTSFKFNNKYNENVYLDVFASIGKDSVKAKVGAIGKRLTPSFRLSTPDALVFAEGRPQESKVSRLRFDHPITYTVTHPNYRKLEYRKIKDEVWSDPIPGGPVYEDIWLTPEMLSTNAPTNFPYNEGLDKLLDGNLRTFFHSTWGSGAYEKLPLDQHPYIEVALAEAIDQFTFKYTTRGDNDGRNPKAFQILGSNDRLVWNVLADLDETDGMPMWGRGQTYMSPNIQCDQPYAYLRFVMTDCQYKNYLALSEFSLHHYLGESAPVDPELISPAQYAYTWQPFGRDYVVDVDWLADADTARVPRIDINLREGYVLGDITREAYLNAQISFDGGNVFPNLVMDTVLIKGRGNTSWGQSNKKPYRLKFATSVKPFGLTKGKNWVLLANNQSGSMLTNMIGMKIARMVGTAGANDIVPVELYINGEYRGSYNFTQHVGLHNNSVDIDETNAVLLELDSYYDELYKFRDPYFNLPTNIKSPELEDILDLNLRDQLYNRIQNDFRNFTMALYYNEQVENWMSPTMLAKYLLVNELSHNTELKHPKSSFLYREDLLALHSKYIFGPVWDLDWGFGYESHSANYNYCQSDPTFDYFGEGMRGTGGRFFNSLRDLECVRRAYYKEWKSFMELHLAEMQEYLDDYYQFARTSLEHNASLWYDGYGYDEVTHRFKNWLTERAQHIYNNLEVFDLEAPVPVERGDVNLDGYITLADVVCLQNYLFGLENTSFDSQQADANADGQVTIVDLVWTVALAMNAEVDFARHMALPTATASLSVQPFTATLGQVSSLPVAMNIVEGHYAATQFDVVLPQGMTLEEVELPDSWEGYQVEHAELGEGRYRVAVYTADGTALPQGVSELNLSVNTVQNVAQEDRVVSLDGVTLVTAVGEDERLSGKSAQFGMEVTGIEHTSGTEAVRGGDALYVDALVAGEVNIYTVDGRLVKVCRVAAGENQIHLPAGVYIVNQQKVMINE